MERFKSVLVVCVDRDNDFGRKANISGPIIGRRENLKAAVKLATIDPEDSDANSVFAAVKKHGEVKKLFANAEIATIIGKGKIALESDKHLNEQLDKVLEQFPADGFVLVTDGAEDDQIIPILQSRAPIISKQTVIVKQAQEIEGAYYAVKEALKDPFIAKLVFGVPGIILLIIIALPSIGLQLVLAVIGAFLLIYGFGVYDALFKAFKAIAKSISMQRSSFPLFIATLFVIAFGLISTYNSLMQPTTDLLLSGIEGGMQLVFFFLIGGLLFVLGKAIDSIHFKKAFLLRNYFLSGASIILIWFILDAGRNVFVGKADLNFFLLTIASTFAAFLIAFKIAGRLDVRKKITKLLVGLPVFDKTGKWIGKVEAINKSRQEIEFKPIKGKENVKVKGKQFMLAEGRILLAV